MNKVFNVNLKTVGEISWIFDEDLFSININGHNFCSSEGSDDLSWFYVYIYYTCSKCQLNIKRLNQKNIILFDSETGYMNKLIFNDNINKFISCEKYCELKDIKNIIE